MWCYGLLILYRIFCFGFVFQIINEWKRSFPLTTTFLQMTLSSSLSTHTTLTQAFLAFKTLFDRSLPGWLLIFLLLTTLKTEFLSIGCKNQLAKIHNTSFLPLCSKSWLRIWRTSYLHWPNYISLQRLLLSHSSTLLYLALPKFNLPVPLPIVQASWI